LLHIDPLYEWHDLVAFINIDKKKLLSGKAQFAQQLYLMELMIRLFYEDLTRKQLSAPYYRHLTELSYNHGVNNEESSLPFLKFIANRYCINPQPKMILICEGESDKTIYSAVLKDIFGRDPSVLGIFFMDIGGVGNAVGSKKHDRRMALKHLIDYQHQLMTIVFVILDNEGGAQHSLSNIYTSRSIWDPNRMVTCKEYTKVWKNCLEIDNFFSEEIALALNRVAQTYNLFNANDVENAKNEKGDCLTLLFKKKVHAELSKPSLAKELAKIIIEKCLTDENPYKSTRPILVTLKRIIWMCSRISLPISQDDEVRQRKFWFSSNYAIRDKRYHDWINEPLMDTE